ncbi:glycine cleavage system protein GcvH [Janibacter limosus]|uniref:Glycine cleavage system protein GcvH n=1 Tax=Janibacter limosus TaxID=53458 RepID=A0AC61U8F3_9MICO|nr:glycine cleavage system protein GcvH [Janibacter limosus]UUZ46314.1 glycine cleavage system protein GcvH [Janibacter limosus]
MSDATYPENLRYTSDHEWVSEAGEGIVRVGITHYAREALGDVVYVSLPAVGDTVEPGDSCGEVESTKSVSDLYAPLGGTITAVNDALEGTPELVNSDPYEQGWMYELQLADGADTSSLLDAAAYQTEIG